MPIWLQQCPSRYLNTVQGKIMSWHSSNPFPRVSLLPILSATPGKRTMRDPGNGVGQLSWNWLLAKLYWYRYRYCTWSRQASQLFTQLLLILDLIIHVMLKKADNVKTGRVHAKPDLRMIGQKEIYVGLQESWFKRDFKKNNQMLPLLLRI